MRTTEIDVTDLNSDRQVARLSKILTNHVGSNAPHKAMAETLSRTAAQSRKTILAGYDDWLDDPTPFTKNPRGTLFERAKAPKNLNPETPKPINLESAVFIRPIQSAYLTNLLEENELDKLYGRNPIIVPVVRNLINFERVRNLHVRTNRANRLRRNKTRRRAGRTPLPTIKKLPNVDINQFGNVKGLRRKSVSKLLAHSDVFEVELNEADAGRSPGIYVRINFDAERRITLKLFHYEPSITIPGIFPFTETAVDVYRENFLIYFREELKDCFNKQDIPIPRQFR